MLHTFIFLIMFYSKESNKFIYCVKQSEATYIYVFLLLSYSKYSGTDVEYIGHWHIISRLLCSLFAVITYCKFECNVVQCINAYWCLPNMQLSIMFMFASDSYYQSNYVACTVVGWSYDQLKLLAWKQAVVVISCKAFSEINSSCCLSWSWWHGDGWGICSSWVYCGRWCPWSCVKILSLPKDEWITNMSYITDLLNSTVVRVDRSILDCDSLFM